ncbi:MAG: DUF6653 family protein [Chloroflexota bacterium]
MAFWSRAWLGWWSLIPIVVAIMWTWLNPRVFPAPRSTDNWASRGVLGERVWMNRSQVPVPDHHRMMPNVLNVVAGLGVPFTIWGVAAFAIWPTLLGMALVYLSKLWFIDRMVWLYRDMKDANPQYAGWLY